MSTRKTAEQKIEELEKKQAQIKARLQRAKAQARETTRKADTRRKIIAGALALEHMEHDEQFAATMIRLLNRHIDRDADRHLFGLGDPPANDEPAPTSDTTPPRSMFSKLAGRSS